MYIIGRPNLVLPYLNKEGRREVNHVHFSDFYCIICQHLIGLTTFALRLTDPLGSRTHFRAVESQRTSGRVSVFVLVWVSEGWEVLCPSYRPGHRSMSPWGWPWLVGFFRPGTFEREKNKSRSMRVGDGTSWVTGSHRVRRGR